MKIYWGILLNISVLRKKCCKENNSFLIKKISFVLCVKISMDENFDNDETYKYAYINSRP